MHSGNNSDEDTLSTSVRYERNFKLHVELQYQPLTLPIPQSPTIHHETTLEEKITALERREVDHYQLISELSIKSSQMEKQLSLIVNQLPLTLIHLEKKLDEKIILFEKKIADFEINHNELREKYDELQRVLTKKIKREKKINKNRGEVNSYLMDVSKNHGDELHKHKQELARQGAELKNMNNSVTGNQQLLLQTLGILQHQPPITSMESVLSNANTQTFFTPQTTITLADAPKETSEQNLREPRRPIQ